MSEMGYIYSRCPECDRNNRIPVTFPAYNKPFKPTTYLCECGAVLDVTDTHSYNEDGKIVDYRHLDENTYRKVLEVNVLLSILRYCTERQGADITITITHDDGFVATARLYDHAALVQGLLDALKYFQSEL